MMTGLKKFLGGLSKSVLVGYGLALVILLGALDYETGSDLSITIFYLVPISLAAWFAGRRAGTLISVASAAAWLVADSVTRAAYIHPIIVFWNGAMIFAFFLIVTNILAALRTSLENEKELASTDDLTGAANRRSFLQKVDIEINRAERYRHPLSIAYIDIDNFKVVNDRSGHSAGDRLLKQVAETMTSSVRSIDQIGRLGGDEFGLLFPETGGDSAQAVIHKMRNNLLDVVTKNRWPVTFSIGLVTCNTPPGTCDDLIRIADDLMYSVKKHGKNRVRHEVVEVNLRRTV